LTAVAAGTATGMPLGGGGGVRAAGVRQAAKTLTPAGLHAELDRVFGASPISLQSCRRSGGALSSSPTPARMQNFTRSESDGQPISGRRAVPLAPDWAHSAIRERTWGVSTAGQTGVESGHQQRSASTQNACQDGRYNGVVHSSSFLGSDHSSGTRRTVAVLRSQKQPKPMIPSSAHDGARDRASLPSQPSTTALQKGESGHTNY